MGFIASSVQLQAQGTGKYRQQVTPQWGISGNINGGWLMAAAAKAAIAELPHAEPLAVSGQYMAPVTPGEIQLEVTPLSQGRSNSVATVKVSQQGRLACFFLVTATDFDFVKGASFEHREPLILAPWQDCSPMESEQAPGVNRIVNLRFPPDQHWWAEKPGSRNGYQCWGGHEDSTRLDALDLLLLVDAVPPALFSMLGMIGWVPTITLSVQLRALRPGSRVKARVQSRSLRNGLAEEEVELWDEQDRLLALSRQLLKARTG